MRDEPPAPPRAAPTRARPPAARNAATSAARRSGAPKCRHGRGDRTARPPPAYAPAGTASVPPATSSPAPVSSPSSRAAVAASRARVVTLQAFVRQRDRPDRDRRTGHRPRPERGAQARRELRRRQRKPEPQAGKPEEFSERAQHHDVASPDLPGQARAGRADIHERLVDDKQAGTQRVGQCEQGGSREKTPVRIVRVHHDGEIRVRKRADIGRLRHLVPGERGDARMFGVGRTQHRGAPGPRERRHQRQQDLGAGRRHDVICATAPRSALPRSRRADRSRQAPAAG